MSTIAPIKVDQQSFDALRFDVLVWNLEGLPKFQRLIVDITLVVRCTGDTLRQVDLVVPFRVRDRTSDVQTLGEDKLGFGALALPGAVNVDDHGASYGDPAVGYVSSCSFRVDPTKREVSDDKPPLWLDRMSRRSPAWSVERLTLTEALNKGETALLRVRYHVYAPTGLVLWKRSGLGINGAFFEAGTKASDVHRKDPLANLLRTQAVKCDAVTITFVLRASLQLRVGAPHVEPSALEGRHWEDYLERWTDLRREGALVAYTRPATGGDIEQEARLFLDVSREFGLLPLGNFFRIAVLTFAILAFSRWIGLIGEGTYTGIPWSHFDTFIGHHFPVISISTGAAVLAGLSTRLRKVGAVLSSLRNRWHRIDRWFWRFLWKQTSH